VYMPCSFPTPVGSITPGRFRLIDTAFRSLNNVGSHKMQLSRLSHTACTLAVYASQHRLPHDYARLASGCWPALPGGVGYPQGSIERFQFFITSSFPKLYLTHSTVPVELLQRYETGCHKA